jgi:hypothetical protein
MQRFKQKFTQLKNAYDEIERERDLIKVCRRLKN